MNMPHPRPPHLQRRKTRHGKYIWVVRAHRTAPIIRIKSEYGTPEFEAEYRDAVNATTRVVRRNAPVAASGTLAWLWSTYRRSQTWARLSPPTKKQRENIMLHVLEKAGKESITSINTKSIRRGVDARADTPFQAKNFLQTMRQLFAWAVENELVKVNPTDGVKVRKPRTSGFPVWVDEEVAKYEERWPLGTRERVMLDVFMYTGLRRGDAARVGKQHVRNGVISLQTEKTGTWVHIPLLPVLQKTLDAGPIGDLAFIVTPKGKPYAKEALGNKFKVACVAAGVLGKSAHGLRKIAATRAAENGATTGELMAIFGWTNVQEAELYTRTFNRKLVAARAIHKLER